MLYGHGSKPWLAPFAKPNKNSWCFFDVRPTNPQRGELLCTPGISAVHGDVRKMPSGNFSELPKERAICHNEKW